jgi:hypothetical protein
VVQQYSNQIEVVAANYQRGVEGSRRSYEDRSKRSWQLSLPVTSYAGKYHHPFYGDMELTVENNVLAVRMGNLHVVSTPFTQKESIRVELIPGTGQVVFFKIDNSGKVNSLSYDGQEYQRVN